MTDDAHKGAGLDLSSFVTNFAIDPEALKDLDLTAFGSSFHPRYPYEVDVITVYCGDDVDWLRCTVDGCTWTHPMNSWPGEMTLAEMVDLAEEHLESAHPDGYETTLVPVQGDIFTITDTYEDALERESAAARDRLDAMIPADGETVTVVINGEQSVRRVVSRNRNEDGTTSYTFERP